MPVAGTAVDVHRTRGGKHSRHRRADGSTLIWRLLKSTSMRPQHEQGSGEDCGFGRFVAGEVTGCACPSAAFSLFIPQSVQGVAAPASTTVALTRGGKHSRHLRLEASTCICLLLKSTPRRPHPEHGSAAICGFGRFVGCNEAGCMAGTSAGGSVDSAATVAAAATKSDRAASATRGPATRGGKHSRHLRRDGSICICRLLKNTPTRLQPEQGSGALQGFGKFASGNVGGWSAGWLPKAACKVTCATSSGLWLGMHSRHFRLDGSTFICLLLKSISKRPHCEHGSGAVQGLGALSPNGMRASGSCTASCGGQIGMTGRAGLTAAAVVAGVAGTRGGALVVSRPGKHSRHLRLAASTCIWRLLKRTPKRPHAEHGSGETCGLGWFTAGCTGNGAPCKAASAAACNSGAGARLGMHSTHLRIDASTFLCLLL
mmetsp:Transcript_69434/g.224545  ORF Transcript_69434/g.224545 Transcript_69434/m.224545 type:complete len:430 (+) Transcript_69434:420-1709(+)